MGEIKMAIIAGWKKYRDSPRLGIVWINKDVDRELKLNKHSTMNHWILSVNNGTGRILSEVDMFQTHKTKKEGIDSAIKYMKSVSVKKVSKSELTQSVVRVMPRDEESSRDEEVSMSYEYSEAIYDFISKILSADKRVKKFECNGNAINIESYGREPVINLKNALTKKIKKFMYKGYADGVKYEKPFEFDAYIGIEWNYWVD